MGAFGVATHLPLDTRTGTRYARAKEPIAFDTAWGENVTQLVLNVDGANALTATTATNGVYVWRPDFSLSRDVTLRLTLSGAVNETLPAHLQGGINRQISLFHRIFEECPHPFQDTVAIGRGKALPDEFLKITFQMGRFDLFHFIDAILPLQIG